MFDWIRKKQTLSPRPTTGFVTPHAVWTPRNYEALTQEGYQKNVIVFRAVNLIAHNLSSVPWVLYDGAHEVKNHSLLDLINRPNPIQTRTSFVESVAAFLLLSGNSYLELVGDENAMELYTLRPDRVRIKPSSSGIPEAYEYHAGGEKRLIPVDPATGNSAVLHMKTFHPLHDWYGMSPIEAAAYAIDQHNAVGSHNLALLQNGGRPTGALVLKPNQNMMNLTEEQRRNLQEDLREAYAGDSNAGRLLLLEGDMEWREMGLSPRDLDFISGKNISGREIAQAFGVPPTLVGIQGDATYANYREARLHLWEDTILPLLDTLIADINRWLVKPYNPNLHFTYDMDRIPALAHRREPIWERLRHADFLTINEKRAVLGYPPLDAGDILNKGDQHDE